MEHTIKWKNSTHKTVKSYSVKKAIKFMCYECQGFCNDKCTVKDCPLFLFQHGTKPEKKK